jgi:hypothetical protein
MTMGTMVILSPSLRSRINSAKDLLFENSRFFGLRPQNDSTV